MNIIIWFTWVEIICEKNQQLFMVCYYSFCRVYIDAGIRRLYAIYEHYEGEDSNEQGTVCLPFTQNKLWSWKNLVNIWNNCSTVSVFQIVIEFMQGNQDARYEDLLNKVQVIIYNNVKD